MSFDSDATIEVNPAAAVPEQSWRRLHPVSPAIRGWKVMVALMAVVTVQNGQQLAGLDLMTAEVIVGIIVGIVGVTVISGGYFFLAWRVTKFAIDDSAVFLHQGVLFRKQRHARLDRIQAIDVVRPILARVFGLSELKIDVAGGAGSSIELAYLPEAQAQDVRNEILARAAGLRVAPSGPGAGSVGDFAPGLPAQGGDSALSAQSSVQSGQTGGGHPHPELAPQPGVGHPQGGRAPEAPEMEIYRVPSSRLVGSILRSSATFFVAIVAITAMAFAVISGEWAVFFSIAPAAIAFGAILWVRFNAGFNFRAAFAQDGIRMHHGLTEMRSQTVPPGRVQAISFSQPLLWRGKDWWAVKINVAGYGDVEGQVRETVLLPVGTRAEAILALWMILPDLGVRDPEAVLNLAFDGKGVSPGFVSSPRSAFWLDPLSWRRSGYTTTGRALITRRGRWHRMVEVVPHERTQSLCLEQGPIQRRLRVASFRVDSTVGPVLPRVAHLDQNDAAQLMDEQSVRAAQARAISGPEKWLTPQRAPAQSPGGMDGHV